MPEAPEVKSPLCPRTTADRHVQSLPAGGVGRPRTPQQTLTATSKITFPEQHSEMGDHVGCGSLSDITALQQQRPVHLNNRTLAKDA